jgi:alkanesulfonate monooxygenase SsuD/methylene tetrahydromethanopterin reductase-like flavin-dependent oxidoreductase (luciferase family)
MLYSGNSIASAEFAAREHLGLCLSFHPANVAADIIARYRAEARGCGWEPAPDQIIYRCFGVVTDTSERAAELEAGFGTPQNPFGLKRDAAPVPSGQADGNSSSDPANAFGLGRMLFAGTPDAVVERLRLFQSLTGIGVVDVVFSTGQTPAEDVRRSIELFGREVLPRIHAFDSPQVVSTSALGIA